MQSSRLSGFTLIEILLYSALVASLLGSFFGASYSIISSSRRDQDRATVVDTLQYLENKLHHALNGAISTEVTPASGAASALEVNRSSGEHILITVASDRLRLQRDTNGNDTIDSGDAASFITPSKVTITGFTVTAVTYNTKPAIQFDATLKGSNFELPFTKTVYFK